MCVGIPKLITSLFEEVKKEPKFINIINQNKPCKYRYQRKPSITEGGIPKKSEVN